MYIVHSAGPYGITTEYEVDWILENIGLDTTIFNGRFLDVGCGMHSRLVRYLRKMMINAEGIDPSLLANEPYLMRQVAASIPRPENYYDFAASHIAHFKDGMDLNRLICYRLVGSEFAEVYAEKKPPMIDTIRDVSRVIKLGSRFVIWPEPRYLLQEARDEITGMGIDISTEPTNSQFSKIIFKGSIEDEYLYRAVLTKL